MESLTREQAIKRIRDIRNLNGVDHLNAKIVEDLLDARDLFNARCNQMIGAINELRAIFDIKEEEL